jgi:PTS system mannitol-specific IIC component
MKGSRSKVAGALLAPEERSAQQFETEAEAAEETHEARSHRRPVHDIVFACDAGMGSSAMGASILRNKIKKAGLADVTVRNVAIANLTDDVDLVVTHQDLTPRAQTMSPSAQHVSVDNFLSSPEYDAVVEQLQRTNPQGAPSTT